MELIDEPGISCYLRTKCLTNWCGMRFELSAVRKTSCEALGFTGIVSFLPLYSARSDRVKCGLDAPAASHPPKHYKLPPFRSLRLSECLVDRGRLV